MKMDIVIVAVTFFTTLVSYSVGYFQGRSHGRREYLKLFGNIRKENEGLTEMLGPWVKLWDDDGKVVPFRRD
jgi:hypothetical protein